MSSPTLEFRKNHSDQAPIQQQEHQNVVCATVEATEKKQGVNYTQ